jgi:uncharacterized protein YjbI with pentapeptide repeats
MKTPQSPIITTDLVSLALTNIQDRDQLSGVRITQDVLAGVEAKAVTLEMVVMTSTEISSSRFKNLSISDVIFDNCRLFGTNMDGADLHRVTVKEGMHSGLALSDSVIEDTTFSRARLNLVNFRVSRLTRVQFIDCDLTEADFQSAVLSNVSFINCNLSRAEFAGSKMAGVDMRSSDIVTIRGMAGLKNATISLTQLVGISQAMAAELGIKVED